MKISKISMTIDEHEFCERILDILRSKLPSYVSLVSATLDGSCMKLEGLVEKLGTHKFALVFEILASADGRDILIRLKRAHVTNTALPEKLDFALVNATLAKSIPDLPGMSYSWADEQLRISFAEIVRSKYGIELNAKITRLSFGQGVEVELS